VEEPSGSIPLVSAPTSNGLANVHIQQLGAQGVSGPASVAAPTEKRKPPNPGFVPRIVSLLAGRDRWLLPILLGALVLSLPSGTLVLIMTTVRRRVGRKKTAVTEPVT
jgi:hypothetical protein